MQASSGEVIHQSSMPVSVNNLHQIPTSKSIILAPEQTSTGGNRVTPPMKRSTWKKLRMQREAIRALWACSLVRRWTLKVINNHVVNFKVLSARGQKNK